MPRNPFTPGLLFLLFPLFSLAQNAPTPQVIVAPGQVITLQVTGLKTVLNGPVQATGLPLPFELAGTSATLTQDHHPATETVLRVPILALEQMSLCAEYPYPADCRVTLITVQIPTEAEPLLWYEIEPTTWLTISENGNSRQFQITASMASVQVIGCPIGPCVTHEDGTLVTMYSPAGAWAKSEWREDRRMPA